MPLIVFGIMMVFLAGMNVFAETSDMIFRTVRENEKPFGWYIQRVQDGNAVLVGKLPMPPVGECVRQCTVVRSDNKAWLVLYRITGGVANIYECPARFFDEDFAPDVSTSEALVPVDTVGLRRLSKEWNIRDYAGEYLLFFAEDGVLKVTPAVFPSGWKTNKEQRSDISKNGVAGYNPKTKVWEKTSTTYARPEEIESFAERGRRLFRGGDKKVGSFTFTKENGTNHFRIRKELEGDVFESVVELSGFPKSFVEINGELWCVLYPALPKKEDFLCRIRVKDGKLCAEKLPCPFYFSGTTGQIFDFPGAVMIKKNGVSGIIVPVKSGRGNDRVFWFDEKRGSWTERLGDGMEPVYDDEAAMFEFRDIQEKRLRKRTRRS